jgi:hypothetical protein
MGSRGRCKYCGEKRDLYKDGCRICDITKKNIIIKPFGKEMTGISWNYVVLLLGTIFPLIIQATITFLAVYASIRLFLIPGIFIAIGVIYFNCVISYLLLNPFVTYCERGRR